MQDRALYALDGLRPTCSASAQQNSAIALATICLTRRGRTALRYDDLLAAVLVQCRGMHAGVVGDVYCPDQLRAWHWPAMRDQQSVLAPTIQPASASREV